jgi:hypothetical protein
METGMSTHRLIQVHNLLDTVSSKAIQSRRAADNAAMIRNSTATASFIRRALRLERIAATCEGRLANG